MARMAQLAADLEDIDAEIQRLHDHSMSDATEEFSALLDRAQIDDLLERRYKLWPGKDSGSLSETTAR